MSTTGNEFEQPGVNHPDRGDAGGATDTPKDDEPQRDGRPGEGGEAADAGIAQGLGGAGATPEQAYATPADDVDEPSHVAVGIGVTDDGTAEHHGQDGGRDTMSASQAQQEGALGTDQEQRLPAMSQNNASQIEKVSGIVVQTRADVATEPFDRVVEVLRQRLEQAGIDLPDAEVEELARQITTGDE